MIVISHVAGRLYCPFYGNNFVVVLIKETKQFAERPAGACAAQKRAALRSEYTLSLVEEVGHIEVEVRHTFKLLMTAIPLLTSCGSIWLIP